jgi:uncharacterized protein involved in exopolysaccharide biosynthesis
MNKDVKGEALSHAESLTLHTLWDDLTSVVRRRKALVLLATAVTIVAVYVGLSFVSDQYEAHASLLVKIGRENAEVPVTVERGNVYSDGVRKEEINSYIALLTSRPLIEATVQEVGLDRFRYRPDQPTSVLGQLKSSAKKVARWGKAQLNELLIRLALRPRIKEEELIRLALEKNLDVFREKEANVINLTLRFPDPVLARDVLDVLTRKYLQRHVEVIRQADSVAQIFEDQTRNYGKTLAELRDAAATLKRELGITSLSEQRSQLLEMLKSAELARLETERERARISAERKALLGRRPHLEEQVLASRLVSPSVSETKAKEQLADLRLQQARALTKYEPKSDPMKKIDDQILQLESFLKQSATEESGTKTLTRNPVVTYIDSQVEESAAKIFALDEALRKTEAQIEQLKEELRRLDQAEPQLQKFQLEINVAEARFMANASRREEARSQGILDRRQVANIVILSPPSYREKPVKPKRLLIMIMGILVGITAGVGLALFLEWQKDTIHSERDLERIGEGVYLGTFRAGAGSLPS